MPWPSERGPANGSKAWQLVGSEVPARASEGVIQIPGQLQALAFRYGYLVGMTSSLVFLWRREGARWTEVTRQPVTLPSGSDVRFVALESGWIGTLTTSELVLFSIPDLQQRLTQSGRYTRLCTTAGALLVADAEHGQLLQVELQADTFCSSSVGLPAAFGEVRDMAASANGIVVATRRNVWWTTTKSDWQQHSVVADWRRVLWAGTRFYALGMTDRGVRLAWLDVEGGDANFRDLHGDYLADMAATHSHLFLLQSSCAERYELERPTVTAERIDIPGSLKPISIAAAVVREKSEELLLVGQTGGHYRVHAVKIPQGQIKPIGITMDASPLVCPAGSILVIGCPVGAGSRLWTYLPAKENEDT